MISSLTSKTAYWLGPSIKSSHEDVACDTLLTRVGSEDYVELRVVLRALKIPPLQVHFHILRSRSLKSYTRTSFGPVLAKKLRAIVITIATTKMSTKDHIDNTTNFPKNTTDTPGEAFEVRQTYPTGYYKPDPAKSIKLSPARQALIDDVIALYSCEPTIERVKRYTPDCVYDDQFVYTNDRCCSLLWPSPGIPLTVTQLQDGRPMVRPA